MDASADNDAGVNDRFDNLLAESSDEISDGIEALAREAILRIVADTRQQARKDCLKPAPRKRGKVSGDPLAVSDIDELGRDVAKRAVDQAAAAFRDAPWLYSVGRAAASAHTPTSRAEYEARIRAKAKLIELLGPELGATPSTAGISHVPIPLRLHRAANAMQRENIGPSTYHIPAGKEASLRVLPAWGYKANLKFSEVPRFPGDHTTASGARARHSIATKRKSQPVAQAIGNVTAADAPLERHKPATGELRSSVTAVAVHSSVSGLDATASALANPLKSGSSSSRIEAKDSDGKHRDTESNGVDHDPDRLANSGAAASHVSMRPRSAVGLHLSPRQQSASYVSDPGLGASNVQSVADDGRGASATEGILTKRSRSDSTARNGIVHDSESKQDGLSISDLDDDSVADRNRDFDGKEASTYDGDFDNDAHDQDEDDDADSDWSSDISIGSAHSAPAVQCYWSGKAEIRARGATSASTRRSGVASESKADEAYLKDQLRARVMQDSMYEGDDASNDDDWADVLFEVSAPSQAASSRGHHPSSSQSGMAADPTSLASSTGAGAASHAAASSARRSTSAPAKSTIGKAAISAGSSSAVHHRQGNVVAAGSADADADDPSVYKSWARREAERLRKVAQKRFFGDIQRSSGARREGSAGRHQAGARLVAAGDVDAVTRKYRAPSFTIAPLHEAHATLSDAQFFRLCLVRSRQRRKEAQSAGCVLDPERGVKATSDKSAHGALPFGARSIVGGSVIHGDVTERDDLNARPTTAIRGRSPGRTRADDAGSVRKSLEQARSRKRLRDTLHRMRLQEERALLEAQREVAGGTGSSSMSRDDAMLLLQPRVSMVGRQPTPWAPAQKLEEFAESASKHNRARRGSHSQLTWYASQLHRSYGTAPSGSAGKRRALSADADNRSHIEDLDSAAAPTNTADAASSTSAGATLVMNRKSLQAGARSASSDRRPSRSSTLADQYHDCLPPSSHRIHTAVDIRRASSPRGHDSRVAKSTKHDHDAVLPFEADAALAAALIVDLPGGPSSRPGPQSYRAEDPELLFKFGNHRRPARVSIGATAGRDDAPLGPRKRHVGLAAIDAAVEAALGGQSLGLAADIGSNAALIHAVEGDVVDVDPAKAYDRPNRSKYLPSHRFGGADAGRGGSEASVKAYLQQLKKDGGGGDEELLRLLGGLMLAESAAAKVGRPDAGRDRSRSRSRSPRKEYDEEVVAQIDKQVRNALWLAGAEERQAKAAEQLERAIDDAVAYGLGFNAHHRAPPAKSRGLDVAGDVGEVYANLDRAPIVARPPQRAVFSTLQGQAAPAVVPVQERSEPGVAPFAVTATSTMTSTLRLSGTGGSVTVPLLDFKQLPLAVDAAWRVPAVAVAPQVAASSGLPGSAASNYSTSGATASSAAPVVPSRYTATAVEPAVPSVSPSSLIMTPSPESGSGSSSGRSLYLQLKSVVAEEKDRRVDSKRWNTKWSPRELALSSTVGIVRLRSASSSASPRLLDSAKASTGRSSSSGRSARERVKGAV